MSQKPENTTQFNDSELADIMSEIENLEKEFEQSSLELDCEVSADPLPETHPSDVSSAPLLDQEVIVEASLGSEDVETGVPLSMEVTSEAAELSLSDELEKKLNETSAASSLQNVIDGEMQSVLGEMMDSPVVSNVVSMTEKKISEAAKGPLIGKESVSSTVTCQEESTITLESKSQGAHFKMSLQGEISLNLAFSQTQQKVQIYLEGDNLMVDVENGCRFSVPLQTSAGKSNRYAA